MSRWDDDEPRRQEVRATEPRERPQRARKNTRRWCRGKVGREHVVEVRLNKYAVAPWRGGTPPCYRAEWSPGRWWCNHERYCTSCGKIIEWSLGDDCPNIAPEITRFKHVRRPR